MTALRIADELEVDITLDHCTEGYLIADEIARSGRSAILGPLGGFPKAGGAASEPGGRRNSVPGGSEGGDNDRPARQPPVVSPHGGGCVGAAFPRRRALRPSPSTRPRFWDSRTAWAPWSRGRTPTWRSSAATPSGISGALHRQPLWTVRSGTIFCNEKRPTGGEQVRSAREGVH